VTVKLVKPTVVHEKEVQVVEKPGETVVVYRDRDPVPGASVSAEPTKAAVKAPTSPAKSAETAATAAPTVAAGSHEYQPPVPGAGPGGPGDPPLPGSGPASGEQLDTGAVSSVVAAKKVGIRRRCIDSATGGTDGVAVTLYLDIQPDGSVASASPTQTKGDSSIGACLAREARNWRFPTSGAGRKVNVPFIFGAGG
jgi:outer membrane biosynthesis protein TonB